MKRITPLTLFSFGVLAPFISPALHAGEEGFISLMDGKTFTGWKKAVENPDTWSIEDGAFVAKGNRCHLFYVGDEAPYTDFHLKVEVWTDHNSNGGIYFHTDYQEEGWPTNGFECQVNVTHKDVRKTGSLYGIADISFIPVKDKVWWTQEIIVQDKTITVLLNGIQVLEYVEPEGAQPGKRFERVLSSGIFALQGHDPDSTVKYRNVRVKRLD